jgi:hypothetical protein
MTDIGTLSISRVLADLVAEVAAAEASASRDYRLVIPAPTPRIARELHAALGARGVKSLLVVPSGDETGEAAGRIHAAGLTSKRIGTFVAVAMPGELAHIQDSVCGSGGALRSLAFSEEWPWIDTGNEVFRFDGPVLDRLVNGWTSNGDDRKWIREFVTRGLLRGTQAMPERATTLLEGMLGTFDPSQLPGLSMRERFLRHSGVPRPAGGVTAVDKFIERTAKLCESIIKRCQSSEPVRDQVSERIDELPELADEAKRAQVRESMTVFFDGLGTEPSIRAGLLALAPCWGQRPDDATHWQSLPQDLLALLFDVADLPKVDVTLVDLTCPRGVVEASLRAVATFVGDTIALTFEYTIPPADFERGVWSLGVLRRGKVIASQDITEAVGSSTVLLEVDDRLGKLSRGVALRWAALQDGVPVCEERLVVHVCGDDRPAFVVTDPEFDVVDLVDDTDDGTGGTRLEVGLPVYAHMLSGSDDGFTAEDPDGVEVDTIQVNNGLWRTAHRADPATEPSCQVTHVYRCGGRAVEVTYEAEDLRRGAFTIEDEFRDMLSGGAADRVPALAALFSGASREPFRRLGGMNDRSRRRCVLAQHQTSRTGWRPLLADLFSKKLEQVGSFGDYVNFAGDVDGTNFQRLALPPSACELLAEYSETRHRLITAIGSRLDPLGPRLEHPLYATHPIFVDSAATETEHLITAHLGNYVKVLTYVSENRDALSWPQLFVLVNLDCVVHWGAGPERNSFFLLGPWHPAVVAKRFMVQAALFDRAMRFVRDDDGEDFRKLCGLLRDVPALRWVVSLSREDQALDAALVSPTSDPGWHTAVRAESGLATAGLGAAGGYSGMATHLAESLGLDAGAVDRGLDSLVPMGILSFSRAFPSRRAIGVRLGIGYPEAAVVEAVDRFLHSDDGPTPFGVALDGGVALTSARTVGTLGEVRWSDPAVLLYQDAAASIRESPAGSDVYMLGPTTDLTFKDESERFAIARGAAREFVFHEPVRWLTEGQAMVPKAVTFEADTREFDGSDLASTFGKVAASPFRILGGGRTSMRSIDLPPRLDSTWAIAPGTDIDPAVFVQYVRNGSARAIQDRALWDFRIDLSGKSGCFYILSTIPQSFLTAVNGMFGARDVASSLINDLGRIGIAIGGEAMRSGRHALGVVGLAAAVRLASDALGGATTEEGEQSVVSFLIPVESFASLLGRADQGALDDQRRTDLLAIRLFLPSDDCDHLGIQAWGIEAKCLTGTFGRADATRALQQGRSTIADMKKLVKIASGRGAMPERLAVLAVLRFGLRVTCPSELRAARQWTGLERAVYESLLQGRVRWVPSAHESVAVVTEQGLRGTPELQVLGDGIWVRLNSHHWPGVEETEHLARIKAQLRSLLRGAHPGGPSHRRPDTPPPAPPPPPPAPPPTVPPPTVPRADEEAPPARPAVIVPPAEPAPTAPRTQTSTPPQQVPQPTVDGVRLSRIFVGSDDDRRPTYFDPQAPVDRLDNMNLMVTGSPGKGKTQFLKYLICNLRLQGATTLILDFKNDFASDTPFCTKAGLECAFVTFDGLPFNPLIPYPIRHPATGKLYLQCGQHIAGVATVLRQTYKLGAQQEYSVKEAIEESFRAAGLDPRSSVEYKGDVAFPDFSLVGDRLKDTNTAAYNRLSPLFSLGLFKDEFRQTSFEALVRRACVLDISQIPSDEIKSALAQLIVLSAHSYFNAQQHSGQLRQVLVFDEAHRVLGSDFLPRLVRECRAYGVGVLLSSQFPTDFPPQVSASMATKVVHGNDRDMDRVAAIIELLGCAGQEAEVASLGRFEAFFANRHHPATRVRMMNYPAFLAWDYLRTHREATLAELASIEGFDATKLPIENIIKHLENLGLVEQRDGHVRLIFDPT